MDALCGGNSNDVSASQKPLAVWMKDGTEIKGVSPILRLADENGKAHGPPDTADKEGNNTIWRMISAKFKTFGAQKGMGWRELKKVEYEGKFEKLTLANEFSWLTYKEVEAKVIALSAGMPIGKGDKVLIYAETQKDWMISALACFRIGAIVVTAYATLGQEGVLTALTQTDASLCICDAKLFKILSSAGQELPSTLKTIATIGDIEAATGLEELSITTIDKMVNEGKATPKDAADVSPDDLAVIMYTSGTTGTSKGVCVTHKSLCCMTISYQRANPQFNSSDSYCAYLPLAHIMELSIELWIMAIGGAMGYGSAHTLTDTGVKLQTGSRGDAPILQPTTMLFAPAVLDKVYAAVQRKIEGSALKQFLFSQALATGKNRFEKQQVGCGPFWDALVMKKIQALIGGRMRYCASGSAPLSADIQIFITSCFNAPCRQGYGATESCGGSAIAVFEDNTTGQVGPPTYATYIRLRDWEEGNYLFQNGMRGEILIGGPTICNGYFIDEKNPDAAIKQKNEEDFITLDGIRYFCTGDIGEVDAMGRLKIIDRKKDLFKGSSGEYVALSKVEAALKLSKYCEMPFVYGRTGEASVIALISPAVPELLALAKSLQEPADASAFDLCKRPSVIKALSDTLTAQCKKAGLHNFEIPKSMRFVLAEDSTPAWTPDNGFLTSTMKLKRPIIAKAFKDEIDAAYSTA